MSYHIQTMVLFEGHLFLSPWPWLGFCLLQIHFSRSGQTSQLFLRDLYPVTDSTGCWTRASGSGLSCPFMTVLVPPWHISLPSGPPFSFSFP